LLFTVVTIARASGGRNRAMESTTDRRARWRRMRDDDGATIHTRWREQSRVVRLFLVSLVLLFTIDITHAAYTPSPSLAHTVTSSLEIERIVLQRALPLAMEPVSDDLRTSPVETRRKNETSRDQQQYEMRSYQLAVFTVEMKGAQEIVAQEKGHEGEWKWKGTVV
jgi:hypothetical protein